jgi:hypothetical protein
VKRLQNTPVLGFLSAELSRDVEGLLGSLLELLVLLLLAPAGRSAVYVARAGSNSGSQTGTEVLAVLYLAVVGTLLDRSYAGLALRHSSERSTCCPLTLEPTLAGPLDSAVYLHPSSVVFRPGQTILGLNAKNIAARYVGVLDDDQDTDSLF